MPSCTLLFVKLGHLTAEILPLDPHTDRWTIKLITAIKRETKDSDYRVFDGLSHSARLDLPVRSSIIIPVEVATKSVGSIAAFSRHLSAFSESDHLFIFSIAQIIENAMTREGIQTLPKELPAIIRAKKQWENTIDNLDHIVCLLDTSGRVERVNRLVEKWHFGTIASVLNRTIHQIFHSNCTDNYDCKFARDIRKAWDEMLGTGESTWATEIPAFGASLHFSLRKASYSDKSDSIDLNSYAILTVWQSTHNVCVDYSRQSFDKRPDLLAAKEEERRHIALELHDGIGQDLTVLKLYLESLQQHFKNTHDQQISKQIKNITYHICESMEEIHRVSADLHPRYLDSRSLPEALKILCEELGKVYNDTKVHCDINIPSDKFTNPLKLTVFRVAQEGLNNALKHSKATDITVSLQQTVDQLVLEIVDNGIGFELAETIDHLTGQGLIGIWDRMELSVGSVVITTGAAKGTTISARWPHGTNQISLPDKRTHILKRRWPAAHSLQFQKPLTKPE